VAEAGCLFGYGIKLTDAYVLAARLADKMLRGASPGETPAEQPVRFEFLINLTAAKRLDVAVPHSLLGRADEVIE
jgi:putative ABC transport system substrate-binding protein